MPFAVVACPNCRQPWAVDLRPATATCPGCQRQVDIRRRARLWEGEDAAAAQQAAGLHRAAAASGLSVQQVFEGLRRPARDLHDSPLDAAAAKASAVTNRSQRAEAAALWLGRLKGDFSHAELLDTLERSGLDRGRAEAEVVRMLALDVLTEPRAGTYRLIPG